MIDTRVNNVKNLSCTQYGHILMAERADTSCTMLINADGVVTKNKNINLCPITFMVNEISLPRRRYTECVLLGGVRSMCADNKIEQIDDALAHIRTSTTTSRRFGSIKKIKKFKANELKSLMHHGSTVLLEYMKPVYREHYSLLLAAINLASQDIVTLENIEAIRLLLDAFVEKYERIYGERYMVSNVHSLLHVYETVEYFGPRHFCSTFSFEGIGHDLVSMVHGTTYYGQQLIAHHQYFRQAIINMANGDYPWKLYTFNEKMLSRKATSSSDIYLTRSVPEKRVRVGVGRD
ncbi:unnamed protein product [Didymodactylos carnosus]|uniref:DUF4218 domain-containing protein n=1 Tax=Didymodactylos carnosus TaxID=1234261 RepID=A0A8S2HZD2_9BILA|nr:unnamed protein product [Didymodactylos carnosus]CAF3699415.1 unnamed protein product [Didymodactylos carnosus]